MRSLSSFQSPFAVRTRVPFDRRTGPERLWDFVASQSLDLDPCEFRTMTAPWSCCVRATLQSKEPPQPYCLGGSVHLKASCYQQGLSVAEGRQERRSGLCEPRAAGEESLHAGPVFPHPAGLPEEQYGHRMVRVAICLAGERSCLVLVSLAM